MKLLTIVGARPQFIKAVVVSRAIAQFNLAATTPLVEEVLVHTGQHFDAQMSDVFFTELEIPQPRYQLGIGGLNHSAMTGRMLEAIDGVLEQERPDTVLVYGDTNSTLAGALAAAKRHIPVAHVEAGLRSFNRNMPEEINRVLTDRVSRWLFCPTRNAVENLDREGLRDGADIRVLNVGDVMYDASLYYRGRAEQSAAIRALMEEVGSEYYVATLHREENTDRSESRDRLVTIMDALARIAAHIPVVLPVHPRTRKALAGVRVGGVRILDPVGYFDMVALLRSCRGVITDSGGVQKEAYFFGKPCITVRDETEWVELVEVGANLVVGADMERILAAERALRDGRMNVSPTTLYGAGDAGHRIVAALVAGFHVRSA